MTASLAYTMPPSVDEHTSNNGAMEAGPSDDFGITLNSAPLNFENEFAGLERYRSADLTVGAKLGQGNFCVVYEATAAPSSTASFLGNNNSVARMAVKRIKNTPSTRFSQVVSVVRDLAREAGFLQSLEHPNIVKLYGISKDLAQSSKSLRRASGCGSAHPVTNNQGRDYFIVLEKLDETLEDRIRQWRTQQANFARIGYRNCQWKAIVRQRIPVALQIAEGLEHLHGRKVVFRDLKPANVGFLGNIAKLLDFGLAAMTHETHLGPAGSPRYMAPEALLSAGQPDHAKEDATTLLDTSTDVFALGVLLWQILTLETPYPRYTPKDLFRRVIQGGQRPPIPVWWPLDLQKLLQSCWSTHPHQRPSMQKVICALREIQQIRRLPTMTHAKSL